MKKTILILFIIVFQNLHGMQNELKNCPTTQTKQAKQRATSKHVTFFSHAKVATVPRYSHPRHYTRDNLSDSEQESPQSPDIEAINLIQTVPKNTFSPVSACPKKQTPFFEIMDTITKQIDKERVLPKYRTISSEKIGPIILEILLNLHIEQYPLYKTFNTTIKKDVFDAAAALIKQRLISQAGARGT